MSKRIAHRVLLIGWEAADWQVIRPLVDSGLMPTLAKLIENGVSGNLATIQPVVPPMLWTSIATGKRADKHGICGFVEPTEDAAGLRPVSSSSRSCKAVWNILSLLDLTSHVVAWYASHPAEPICGSVVSDRFASFSRDEGNFVPRTFYPTSEEQQIGPKYVQASDIQPDVILPFVPQLGQIEWKSDLRLQVLVRLIARTSSIHSAACHKVAQQSWDFSAVYYPTIGEVERCLGSSRGGPLEARIPTEDLGRDIVVGCYRFLDMMLETLSTLAGPETTVLLVSDHGSPRKMQQAGTDSSLWRDVSQRGFGIACAQGPGIRRNALLHGATVLDVTPTILAILGQSIGNDMDGRPWLEIFEEPFACRHINSWESVKGNSGRIFEEVPSNSRDMSDALQLLSELGVLSTSNEDIQDVITKISKNNRINLALALTDSNRVAQAIEAWKNLVTDYPDEPEHLIQLASCYMRLEHWLECREALSKLEAERRQSSAVQLILARLALNEGRNAEAIRIARKLAERSLSIPHTLNRIGDLLLQASAWEDAQSVFQRSLAANEKNPIAHDGLTRVYLELDRLDTAVEHGKRAVELIHHFPAAHFHLGSALFYAGREEEAIAAFETCLSMGYELEETHCRLAGLYLLRDPVKAIQHRKLANLS